jgi:tRNA U34 5-carboxymethylaminomethyl modifying enzyme MnmG/GidA
MQSKQEKISLIHDSIITDIVSIASSIDDLEQNTFTVKKNLEKLIGRVEVLSDIVESLSETSPIELSPTVLDSIDNAISVLSYIRNSNEDVNVGDEI